MTDLGSPHLGAFHGVDFEGSAPWTRGTKSPKPKHQKRLLLIDIEKMSKKEGLSEDEIEAAFLRYQQVGSKRNPKEADKVARKARTLAIPARAECYRVHIMKSEAGDKCRLFFIRLLAILMYTSEEGMEKLTTGKVCLMANISYSGKGDGRAERSEALRIIREAREEFFKE